MKRCELARMALDTANRVSAPHRGLSRSHFLCPGRQPYDGEPEVLDGLHHLHELSQVHRLLDVAVSVQPVGPENVFFHGGQRQYDDGRSEERRVGKEGRSRWPPY